MNHRDAEAANKAHPPAVGGDGGKLPPRYVVMTFIVIIFAVTAKGATFWTDDAHLAVRLALLTIYLLIPIGVTAAMLFEKGRHDCRPYRTCLASIFTLVALLGIEFTLTNLLVDLSIVREDKGAVVLIVATVIFAMAMLTSGVVLMWRDAFKAKNINSAR